MRIEQYFLTTDYSLWEVILNCDSPAPTRVGSSSESLDQIHDRLQKLISQLEIHVRNKTDLEEQSLDDLFNSLKIYEAEVKISAAASVSAISAKLPVSPLPNVDSLSNAIDADDLNEMDLKWQMAMKGHFARECRSSKDTRKNAAAEPQRRNVLVVTYTLNALVSQCDGVGSYDWSFQAEEEPTNYALMAFLSSSYSSDNDVRDDALVNLRQNLEKAEQERDDLKLNDDSFPPSPIYDRYQSGNGYHAVPLPYTGIFMPPIPDLVFNNAPTDVETDHPAFIVKLSPTKPDYDLPSVQHVETTIPAATPTGNHKQYAQMTLKNPQRHMVPAVVVTQSKPVSITAARPVSTAVPKIKVTRPRHVQPIVTKTKSPTKRHINCSPSPKTSNSPPDVTAVKDLMVNAAKGKQGKWEWKPKCLILDHGNPQHALKDERVIDNVCSRHMTGNMSYLSNFEELNGGYVAFGGNPKGGKFDGKVDEGFLVGYSVSSKAFRVFNSRTYIVQETLHVNFMENQSNVAGSGPTWLFDIDTLTKTMNYQPVTAGNQSNPSVSFQDKFDAEKAGEESDQQYVLFPVWSSGSTNPHNTDGDVAFDEKEPKFDEKMSEFEVNVSPSSSAQLKKHDDKTKKEAKGKSPVNAAGTLVPTIGQNSPNSTNTFSVAGPLNATAFPTHGKSSFVDASQLSNDPDVPKLEDITYSDDEDDVGTKQDLSHKDTHEDGINYEEVFTLVARIEAIRLFLAYASFMGFMVYQMDVKSAFLYGTIKKEVYVCQPLGFDDPNHPDKVYKVVKGLQVKQKKDGIFISQDKYVAEILRKFRLTKGKSASTPIDTEKPRLKDPDGEDVDVHTYRSMIGSLMYLTSLKPDIMFAFWTTVAVKKVNDVMRFQALVNKKKVVVTEATIREALCLNDAEGVECLPKEEIFVELARMGYEKPSTKLTFYKAFLSSQKQVGDLSTHTIKYTSPTLTQKVFANIQRVGKGFSGVKTPLFEAMLVAHKVSKGVADEEHDEGVPAGGVVTEGDVSTAHDEVPTADEEPSIPSPTPLTPPPQPSHDIPSTSQSAQDQGRKAESQEEICKIDLEHANKVLSMQEDETKPAKVQEIVEVATTAKLITKVVTAAYETITAAITAAPSRRRKGVVIRDPQEESTTSIMILAETKSKDKGKGILVEEPKPLKKQAQIEQDEKYARELEAKLNKNIDWDEVIDHVKKKDKEDHMLNAVRLEVEEESEVSLELLRGSTDESICYGYILEVQRIGSTDESICYGYTLDVQQPSKHYGCGFCLGKETQLHELMSSPGAPLTPSYSTGPSTPPSNSSGPSMPPSYSSGPLTPTNYYLGSSRNAECSNCKHLLGKLSVLKAIMDMNMHLEQHTINSAALLYEVLNEMEKLNLE
nr:hypothetical protein [Tanacetum cinerariifolium]